MDKWPERTRSASGRPPVLSLPVASRRTVEAAFNAQVALCLTGTSSVSEAERRYGFVAVREHGLERFNRALLKIAISHVFSAQRESEHAGVIRICLTTILCSQ